MLPSFIDSETKPKKIVLLDGKNKFCLGYLTICHAIHSK